MGVYSLDGGGGAHRKDPIEPVASELKFAFSWTSSGEKPGNSSGLYAHPEDDIFWYEHSVGWGYTRIVTRGRDRGLSL